MSARSIGGDRAPADRRLSRHGERQDGARSHPRPVALPRCSASSTTPRAGRDAGEVVDGRRRELPCFATLDAALDALPRAARLAGGRRRGARREDAGGAAPADPRRRPPRHRRRQRPAPAPRRRPEIAGAAAASGARLHDIRRPKRFAELRSWHGEALAPRPCRASRCSAPTARSASARPRPSCCDGLRAARPRGRARHHRPDRLAAGAPLRLRPRRDAERLRHRRARARRRRLRARGRAGPDPDRRTVGAAQPERAVRRRAGALGRARAASCCSTRRGASSSTTAKSSERASRRSRTRSSSSSASTAPQVLGLALNGEGLDERGAARRGRRGSATALGRAGRRCRSSTAASRSSMPSSASRADRRR